MNDLTVGAAGASHGVGNAHKTRPIKPVAPSSNTEPTDQVSLSDDAVELLGGKNPKSPAHRASAALATEEFGALSKLPFGRLVSTLARGGELSALLPSPVQEPEPEQEPQEIANIEQDLSGSEIALSLLKTNSKEVA